MEQLSDRVRLKVLAKVLILGMVPPLAMVAVVVSGVVTFPVCLFNPSVDRNRVEYQREAGYPETGLSLLRVEVEKHGPTRMELTAEGQNQSRSLWEGKVDEDGKYREAGGGAYYTLFWVPVPHAFPVFRRRHMRELSEDKIIDLTGFLGKPRAVYRFSFGDHYKNLLPKNGGYAVQEVDLLGPGEAVAGRALYEVSTGLLLSVTSFAKAGERLSLEQSTIPLGFFRQLLLPLVLLCAVGLAAYELLTPVFRNRKFKIYLSESMEFIMLGYTAMLLDVYLDYYYFSFLGGIVVFAVHGFLFAIFWARLGWWSILPLVELISATVVMICAYNYQPVFAYFPATIMAWVMALIIQGALSPGRWPEFLSVRIKF